MEILSAGETLKIERCIPLATAAKLRIGGPAAYLHDMVAQDNGHWLHLLNTEAMPPGVYALEILATYAGGEKSVVWRETVKLNRAPGQGDVRSEARIALDNIRAVLAKQASEGVQRYRINNRELWRYSIAELKDLEAFWAQKVRDEDRKNSGKTGLGPKILVQF